MKKFALLALACALVLALALAGCSSTQGQKGAKGNADVATTTLLEPSPDWVVQLPEAETVDQLFVVAAYDTSTAWISLHQKDEDGTWQTVMTTPGYIGKAGLGKTREGDAKTPTGTFGFDAAFGIAEDPGCAIPYTQVDDDTYWSGDVREGHHYNEMVSIADIPDLDTDASEHIIDYTREYQYCLNLDFNKDCVPGAGSAVFVHCLGARKPYTGGCIAMPQDQMLVLMQNVLPECVVVIDSLENLGGSF